MPLMQKGVAMMSRRMPKVINPTVHAVIDYAVAATFFTMGVVFWKRNKTAALSSFICGAAATANSIVTDYPGGVLKIMNFQNHGRIDMGLGALTAALPQMMDFANEHEGHFFQGMAVAETAAAAMTDFEALERTGHLRHEAA